MIAHGEPGALSLAVPMADTTAPPEVTVHSGDPGRPRYLGLWVAVILLLVLLGGAGGVITDVLYRQFILGG
jgi:hypothetical protein